MCIVMSLVTRAWTTYQWLHHQRKWLPSHPHPKQSLTVDSSSGRWDLISLSASEWWHWWVQSCDDLRQVVTAALGLWLQQPCFETTLFPILWLLGCLAPLLRCPQSLGQDHMETLLRSEHFNGHLFSYLGQLWVSTLPTAHAKMKRLWTSLEATESSGYKQIFQPFDGMPIWQKQQ